MAKTHDDASASAAVQATETQTAGDVRSEVSSVTEETKKEYAKQYGNAGKITESQSGEPTIQEMMDTIKILKEKLKN